MNWWAPVKKACEDGTAPPTFVRDALLAKYTQYAGNDEEAIDVFSYVNNIGRQR